MMQPLVGVLQVRGRTPACLDGHHQQWCGTFTSGLLGPLLGASGQNSLRLTQLTEWVSLLKPLHAARRAAIAAASGGYEKDLSFSGEPMMARVHHYGDAGGCWRSYRWERRRSCRRNVTHINPERLI